MTIDEIRREVGVTRRTVRYYEELGLIDPPTRTETGWREYDAGHVSTLRIILQLTESGITLNEILAVAPVFRKGRIDSESAPRLLRRVDRLGRKIKGCLKNMKSLELEIARFQEDLTGRCRMF